MKVKRAAIALATVVLILVCFNTTGNNMLRKNTETAIIAENIKSTEDTYTNNETDTSYYEGEEQETNIRKTLLQDEECVVQTVESDGISIKTSTDRILTNELCVGIAKEIFDATNAERAKAGVAPLIWDDELAKYSNIRAEEIITNFSHIREDGTKCYELSDLIWGENIAKSPPQSSGCDFVVHWMASEGHKKNILEPRYTTIGVGIFSVEEGYTAVQLFGIDVIE